MLRNVHAEDFPPTVKEMAAMEKKEIKLQEMEVKNTESSIHCLAWKIRACLFQRATGKTSLFHEQIKTYQWVQCTTCKNWLHFECAGLTGDWNERDFFCGCSVILDIDKVLESVQAEHILIDSEIKDLERNLQSGNVFFNRMYLWKHRGLDPVLRQYYCEHITTFIDMMTEAIIQRLENILSVPGNGAENQQFILEVLLPEVVILWLQRSNNMCRYQAETLLMKTKSVKENDGDEEMTTEAKGTEKGSNILTDSQTAADWCQKTTFPGRVTFPKVLDMDNTEQTETLEAIKNWEDEHDDSSPAELLTFVFQKKEDYEKFCKEIMDVQNINIFARFEED
ncbi:hypothetical protein ATANTOWER_021574 [Ataeniobius toweri]|uniref:Zinc finger PHD-type domain-containing protein n=1 Tax=Ataeniobius toweri TaxID=208326 RepID=A0ABU7C0Q3_9TELE|nr:hypothetical protein [Ataeniobius toweri]